MGRNFDDYPDFQPKITHPKDFCPECNCLVNLLKTAQTRIKLFYNVLYKKVGLSINVVFLFLFGGCIKNKHKKVLALFEDAILH